ncbi:MAG: hypothetical protein M0C28_45185 [Candidatus Moduliflexus flocculans]|nr:hypothetical protein [Candidatus Moduliflexus flocculans]
MKDVFDIFRDTYEGTPYDMTRTLLKVDRDGKAVKSPVANPFMNNDYLDLLKVARRADHRLQARDLPVRSPSRASGCPTPSAASSGSATTTR